MYNLVKLFLLIMNYVNYDETNYGQKTIIIDETRASSLMNKVYLWMVMGLGLTALTSWLSAINGWLYYFGGIWQFVLLGVELLLVIGLTAMIRKLSMGVATFMFVTYSILNGLTLSAIFSIYEIGSILLAFIISASLFAVLAIWGTVTKRDMSSFSKVLMPALIALVIAGIINIFWANSLFDMIISCGGVLIFAGLTVYDANKIKQMSQQVDPYGQEVSKMALLGALTMYLDFINLFLYLLRILGRARN